MYDSQFQQIGSRERSELADYIMFNGAIPETFGMKKFKPNRSSFPDFNEKGWRGRFSKQVFTVLNQNAQKLFQSYLQMVILLSKKLLMMSQKKLE